MKINDGYDSDLLLLPFAHETIRREEQKMQNRVRRAWFGLMEEASLSLFTFVLMKQGEHEACR